MLVLVVLLLHSCIEVFTSHGSAVDWDVAMLMEGRCGFSDLTEMLQPCLVMQGAVSDELCAWCRWSG